MYWLCLQSCEGNRPFISWKVISNNFFIATDFIPTVPRRALWSPLLLTCPTAQPKRKPGSKTPISPGAFLRQRELISLYSIPSSEWVVVSTLPTGVFSPAGPPHLPVSPGPTQSPSPCLGHLVPLACIHGGCGHLTGHFLSQSRPSALSGSPRGL